jgi:16S rRNA (cytosine1402-N4)-methyltransferase
MKRVSNPYHIPVLLHDCIDALAIKPDGIYVDVTFGGGGHSKEILKKLGEKGKLIAFDQDADALLNVFEDDRFELIEENFEFIKNFLRERGIKQVDGILADLGVSSHQFDIPERGFSIRFDAPLDMRMNQSAGITAAKLINSYSEEQLSKLFWEYGELKNARAIARRIVQARLDAKINTVFQLKEAIKELSPRGKENQFYAKVFQGIRIEVNRELEVLENFLQRASDLLGSGGRLVVMSYHSLEDRLVKNFMRSGNYGGVVEKDFYGNPIRPLKPLSGKAIKASDKEIELNSRARSARLRVAEKV